MANTKLAIGDWVKVKGSSAWMTPEPVQIIGFGVREDKGNAPVVDFSDGQWAYRDEVVLVSKNPRKRPA